MLEGIFQTLGGLGLFLLGMIIMTDGLKHLANRYIRNLLTRFTSSPTSGAITGAISTAILQSSSATTVAAVGFVSAGLLTFPHALGIIFGANLGTTITGWLVALLGFKLKLGTMVMPLIFIGVLLRFFSRDRIAAGGLALAGFGLIFVGISQLQAGMEGMQEFVSPDNFPDDTWGGRLQLVAMGIGVTIITQSSSAGIAAAITAVYIGTISFSQAAALVIGMDVGTTITAVLATIGGGIESRRTGFSHVFYNLYTAIGALLLLTPYVWLWENLLPGRLNQHAEIALVAFHSSFNLIGIILILPFTNVFSRFTQVIIPDKPYLHTKRLDVLLLKDPDSALQAIYLTLKDLIRAIFQYANGLLTQMDRPNDKQLRELRNQLDLTHRYIDKLHIKQDDKKRWGELLACIHTIDHLIRLYERCEEDTERVKVATSDITLNTQSDLLSTAITTFLLAVDNNDWEKARHTIEDITAYFRVETPDIREQLMQDVASGKSSVPDGIDRLEAIRSLRRMSQHMDRITHYMKLYSDLEQGDITGSRSNQQP